MTTHDRLVMETAERDAVLHFVRSYLGSARCGLVDPRWSEAQKAYGNQLVDGLINRIDFALGTKPLDPKTLGGAKE